MNAQFTHGFRTDPMTWVGNSDSLEAAQLRLQVFQCARDGDAERLSAAVDEILSTQRDDGSFGDKSKETGVQLLRALELGAAPDRVEVQRAAQAILRQARKGEVEGEWYERDGEVLSVYALHALCLLGLRNEPEVPYSLECLIHHPEEWNSPYKGCPSTPAVFWSALWAGRQIAMTKRTVSAGLAHLQEDMNDVGCCAYNDPWGFTDTVGRIDSPEARAIVEKQIPLMLRAQHPDGSFGGVSLPVLRALHTHGCLDRLRELPPLPDDFRVVRDVPLPDGMWFSLAWDGERVWSFDHKRKEAVALSPIDGHEIRRVAIANCHAIGWWDGALMGVGSDPKQLRRVDPHSGDVLRTISLEHMERIIDPEFVDGKLVVGDSFLGCVSIVDPAESSEPRMQSLAGPFPACLAADGSHVWHADRWAPAIIKSDLQGNLIDWGGKPFGIQGFAHDGTHLWALDGEAGRLRVMERAPSSTP